MSSTIKQAIQALKSRIASAYAAVETKGGTLPATQDSANLPAAIASIPSGGGGDIYVNFMQLDSSVASYDLRGIKIHTLAYRDGNTPGGFFKNGNIEVVGIRCDTIDMTNLALDVNTLKKVYFAEDVYLSNSIFARWTLIEDLDITHWKVASGVNVGNFLQTLTYNTISNLIGDHTLQEVLDGEVTVLEGISNSFQCSSSALDRASLLAVIKGLADLTGQTAQTLTIGANNLAKLTSEDLAIATNKNWNIA